MAPEYDFEPDDFDHHHRELRMRSLQAEVNRLQRKVRNEQRDINMARDIAFRLRGMSISEEAYCIIREAIEHARYHYFHRRDWSEEEYEHEMRKQRIMEEKYLMARDLKAMPYKMFWDDLTPKKEDFLDEKEMEL